MRQTRLLFFSVLLFALPFSQQLHASILSAEIYSIEPNFAVVGETITIRIVIEEDVKLKAAAPNYRYRDNEEVEFQKFYRSVDNEGAVLIVVMLKAKQSGTIDIPDIYENNYRIRLPIITVASSITDQSYYIPAGKQIPLFSILHLFFSSSVIVGFLLMNLMLALRFRTFLRIPLYYIKSTMSYYDSIHCIKRMIRKINRIVSSKVKKPMTSKQFYTQLGEILKKRLRFLIGVQEANSMTYTEMARFLQKDALLNKVIAKSQFDMFFRLINEVEYGTHSYPLEERKKHCQFLLQLFRLLRNYDSGRQQQERGGLLTISS